MATNGESSRDQVNLLEQKKLTVRSSSLSPRTHRVSPVILLLQICSNVLLMARIMRENATLCEEFVSKLSSIPLAQLSDAKGLTAPWLLTDNNVFNPAAAAAGAGALALISPTDDQDGKKRKRKRGDKEKKIKDPLAPKRPPSAYLLYQNEVRGAMKEKFKDLSYKEVLGEIAKSWANMTAEDKKVRARLRLAWEPRPVG